MHTEYPHLHVQEFTHIRVNGACVEVYICEHICSQQLQYVWIVRIVCSAYVLFECIFKGCRNLYCAKKMANFVSN